MLSVYPAAMHQIVNIIGPTFFAVVVGYLFGRFAKVNMAPLIDIAMYVAVPALAFHSMVTSKIVLGEASKLWASSLIVMVGNFVLALVLFGFLRQKHSGLYLPIVFTNYINIPLPIIFLAFGAPGAALAILMYIPQGIVLHSLGVYVASGEKEMKQGMLVMIKTPLMWAAIVGLALSLAHVPIPRVVIDSVNLLGQAGVPLMLLILGVSIGRFRFRQISLTAVASILRVGGGFAFGILSVWLLGLVDVSRAVVLFEASMPSAVFVSVLAAKYKNEEELVSSVVLATTLMAIAVIPALLYYLT
jgi:malate permease and related proteins